MKVLALVLLVVLPVAGCDKHENAAASQPASTPATVQPLISAPVSSSSFVSPQSGELVPVSDPAVVIPTVAIPAVASMAKQADVQVYKCKTEQGVTFSDAPCGENQEQLSVRETSVIDNAGLREKAAEWQQQDAIAAQKQLADDRAAASTQASVANKCFDGEGNQIACGNSQGQYSPPWYGDPYDNPYDNQYGQRYPNRHQHDGRYRDTIPASKDGRYDARDRVIESRFQDPSRTIKQHLGIDGQ